MSFTASVASTCCMFQAFRTTGMTAFLSRGGVFFAEAGEQAPASGSYAADNSSRQGDDVRRSVVLCKVRTSGPLPNRCQPMAQGVEQAHFDGATAASRVAVRASFPSVVRLVSDM